MMLQGFDCQRCLSSGSVWIHAKRPCYDACGSLSPSLPLSLSICPSLLIFPCFFRYFFLSFPAFLSSFFFFFSSSEPSRRRTTPRGERLTGLCVGVKIGFW